MQSRPVQSPFLPWEVIERIISHSWDPDPEEPQRRRNPASILNFSLACRELRPRSLCFLVADPVFYSRNDIFDFCNFLQANPHLKPFVRSIAVEPKHFAPVPLLRILPNLSKIEFTNDLNDLPLDLNQSILTTCRLLSSRIQTLSLSNLRFTTSLQFFRVLSSFTTIAYLVCHDTFIEKPEEGNAVSAYIAKQQLSQRLRLLTLHIAYDVHDKYGMLHYGKQSVGTLLVESGLVQSTVESLTAEMHRSSGFLQKLDWPRLRSLTLKFNLQSSSYSESEKIADGIVFLKDIQHSTLKEVTIEVYERDPISTLEDLTRHADLYTELEHTLLGFSHPQLVWTIDVMPIRRNSWWAQEFRMRFPALSQRGALRVVPRTKRFCVHHGEGIVTLTISPDNRWAATRSAFGREGMPYTDGTVTLWDVPNGEIVQQWALECYSGHQGLRLAFSPNSQYLISGTRVDVNPKTVIWDLSGGIVKVLEGHTENITSCAWSASPRGDVIASGSRDASIRLWDANTFQPLHVFKHATGESIHLVKFSPDGRWLLTGSLPYSYYLWDVVSGTGRKLRAPIAVSFFKIRADPAAAFNPGSTRFVIVSPRLGGIVEILDTEGVGGSHNVVLGASGSLGGETKDVAFSPDGSLVLTVPNHRVKTHAIRIWDAHTGVEVLSLEGHEDDVNMACFSPCGKYVASASNDRTVRLWRTRDGSCIATLSERTGWVKCVAFTPDGKTLVSVANNASVIIRQMCSVLPIDEQDP